MPKRNGTAYERVTRNMVENLKETMNTGFTSVNSKLQQIEDNQKELFNHQSSRLPMWATIAFTIGGSLITGMIIWIVTH